MENTPIIQNKATTSYLSTSEKKNLQPDLTNSEKIIIDNAPRLLRQYFRDDTLESMVAKLKTDLKQLNINSEKHQKNKNNQFNSYFFTFYPPFHPFSPKLTHPPQ